MENNFIGIIIRIKTQLELLNYVKLITVRFMIFIKNYNYYPLFFLVINDCSFTIQLSQIT